MPAKPLSPHFETLAVWLLRDLRSVLFIQKELASFNQHIHYRSLTKLLKSKVSKAEWDELKKKRALPPDVIWKLAVLWWLWKVGTPPKAAHRIAKSLIGNITPHFAYRQFRLFEKGRVYKFTKPQIKYLAQAILARDDFANLVSQDPTYTAQLGNIILDAERMFDPRWENKQSRQFIKVDEIYDALKD